VHQKKHNIYTKLQRLMRVFDMQAMPGFILVVSTDGKLLYVSDNVADYLGHSSVSHRTTQQHTQRLRSRLHIEIYCGSILRCCMTAFQRCVTGAYSNAMNQLQ
jgi:hypothetical protein